MTPVSFDCEATSLTGDTFAVGAVTDDGRSFFGVLKAAADCYRHGRPYGPACEWVNTNVGPAITDRLTTQLVVSADYQDYQTLCLAFFDWVLSIGPVRLVADCGHPVEGRFWADCLRFAEVRRPGAAFSAPCPVHEVATAIEVCGRSESPPEAPEIHVGGRPHDPVYDAAVSLARWRWANQSGGVP